MIRFSKTFLAKETKGICPRRLRVYCIWGLLLTAITGIVVNCSSDKPTEPTSPCQATGDPSAELLTRPVYSPTDTSVYYVDSGAPESYFEEFREHCGAHFTRVVPAGIYRVRLNDDSPAELVLANAADPRISPDGKTMYCIRGAMGAGEIWQMSLPDGEPELVKGGDLMLPSWYGPDTLLVKSWAYGISLLDIGGDSLIDLHINGYSADVSVDKKICHVWGGAIYIFDAGEDRLLRSDFPGNAVAGLRWSPDGKEITFVSSPPVQIRVIDLEGRERPLTSGGETDPSFTSDGENIVYVKTTRNQTPAILDGQVWIMSAKDGSQKRQVTTWSRIRPSSRRIRYFLLIIQGWISLNGYRHRGIGRMANPNPLPRRILGRANRPPGLFLHLI
jgi:dipeptidyl aminopeptidase/acylaminoacyl peptidase